MRFFIAIEPQSIIKPGEVKKILTEHCRPDEFAVLPVYGEGFPNTRSEAYANEISRQARREAENVLKHYRDAAFCVVVYRSEAGIYKGNSGRKEQVPIDRALAVWPDLKAEYCILNDVEDDHRYSSHEATKPHLLDNLINFTLIKLAKKYADA